MRIHHVFLCLIKMFRHSTDLQTAMYEHLIQLMHDECLTHMLLLAVGSYIKARQSVEPYTL